MIRRKPSVVSCLFLVCFLPWALACGAEERVSVLDHFIAHSGGGDLDLGPVQALLLDVTRDGQAELFLSALAMSGNDGNSTWYIYSPTSEAGGEPAHFLGSLVLQDDGFHFDERSGRLIHMSHTPDGAGYQTNVEACSFTATGVRCAPERDLDSGEGTRALRSKNQSWASAESTYLARITLRELRDAARGQAAAPLELEAVHRKSTFGLPGSWLNRPVIAAEGNR